MANVSVRKQHPRVKAGDRFGRLVVLHLIASVNRGPTRAWVRCECGVEKPVDRAGLAIGRTKSCGCLRRELRPNHTHGESRTALYWVWQAIKGRTGNPDHPQWPDYGGRGIIMHPAWRDDFVAFRDYVLGELGGTPTRDLSLDRINNDRGYEPGNLRLATQGQQRRNGRRSVLVEVAGEQMCLQDACERLGLPYGRISMRVQRARARGVTAQEILDEAAG